MFSRSISDDEIRAIILTGERIEDYPTDRPYPSFLLLGRPKGRALHVVAASNIADDEIIIITVYEPDHHLWEIDLKTRRKK
jgi:hypothetical protein